MENKRLKWLEEKRKQAGFKSMRKFAEHIGLSPSYYSEIETGVKSASANAMGKISQALEIDMALFYTKIVRNTRTK